MTSDKQKTTMDMTYAEFEDWAAQHVADGIMQGGFPQMRRHLALVLQQEAMIFTQNKGFQQKEK